ncbi:hypothetical protein CIRG_04329 [Coccidioides immitis RMSCC 2394]|uniref:Choline transport protein n=1 Tax=Coccidioides immitis RMSCC 2394 TaxID=404692 RepID=A0A0J6YCQ2_COCIT|nr:hypothetical protein CIRG_04329 [Coccidioides immitis RMSCC 2394]
MPDTLAAELKTETGASSVPVDDETQDDSIAKESGGTWQDKKDMWRAGVHQELNRNFRFFTILGFATVLMATWESVMFGSSVGLTNGGIGGMVYSYIAGIIGFAFVILSMAEMASMAPISGGQYHWISEFAPNEYQQLLSYVSGWVCVLGWHTGIAGSAYTVANMIIGIIEINHPDTYIAQPWHGTLLVIAVAFIAMIFNTVLAPRLPLIERTMLVFYVLGFFGIPNSLVGEGTIEDNGGWGSRAGACILGLVGSDYINTKRAAEEIKDSSRTLPVAMLGTLALNGIVGFIMLITYVFCIPSSQEALKHSHGFPFIYVFLQTTGSVGGTTGMTVIIMLLQVCSAVSNVASTSRQLYAFARDGGVPFPHFFAKVNRRFVVPLNALLVSFIITCLLALINIGSVVAFNAILSLGVASLLSSYIISIACVRLKRWRGEPLPPARWSMGKWASIVETLAILFLLVVWVCAFFPLKREMPTSHPPQCIAVCCKC